MKLKDLKKLDIKNLIAIESVHTDYGMSIKVEYLNSSRANITVFMGYSQLEITAHKKTCENLMSIPIPGKSSIYNMNTLFSRART